MHLEERSDIQDVFKALERSPLQSHVPVVAAEELDVADAFNEGYLRGRSVLRYLDHFDDVIATPLPHPSTSAPPLHQISNMLTRGQRLHISTLAL